MRANWKEESEGFRCRESGRVIQLDGPYTERVGTKGEEFGARDVQAERVRGGAKRGRGNIEVERVGEVHGG